MDKHIEVLGIGEDSKWGAFAGCSAFEWADMDDQEIVNWFGNHKMISFDDGSVLEFFQVCPYFACFGNGKGHAILKLSALPINEIETPAKAFLA